MVEADEFVFTVRVRNDPSSEKSPPDGDSGYVTEKSESHVKLPELYTGVNDGVGENVDDL